MKDQLMFMMKTKYEADALQVFQYMLSLHELLQYFFFYIIIFLHSLWVQPCLQTTSLISSALFLTFTTMCHYQRGLDSSGLTFKA